MWKKLKFILWLVKVTNPLDEKDRQSLKDAIERLSNYEDEKDGIQRRRIHGLPAQQAKDWEEWYQNIPVKDVHDFLIKTIPTGSGYLLLVSAIGTEYTDAGSKPDVRTFMSSNLGNGAALRLMEIMKRHLGPQKPQWPPLPLPPCDEIDVDPTKDL